MPVDSEPFSKQVSPSDSESSCCGNLKLDRGPTNLKSTGTPQAPPQPAMMPVMMQPERPLPVILKVKETA